jgi:hypothetical protein
MPQRLHRLFSWFEREPAHRRGWQGPGEGSVGVATDIGPEREENEDRAAIAGLLASDGVDFLLAIVCDGIGGMAHGGECALLATGAFIVGFLKNHRASLEDRLRSAAEQANAAVHRHPGRWAVQPWQAPRFADYSQQRIVALSHQRWLRRQRRGYRSAPVHRLERSPMLMPLLVRLTDSEVYAATGVVA